jgi:uncharacterized cupin superfamily protein
VKRLHLEALPWEEYASPGGRFRAAAREVSIALGAVRHAPRHAGGHPFELEVFRVPAGASPAPFHRHLAQWELFVVLAGEGRLRTDAGSFPLRAGDAFIHPPGHAHQLQQCGAAELVMVVIADNPPVDVFHYPDSGKWGIRGLAGSRFFRPVPADYWEGEDPGPMPVAPPPWADLDTSKLPPVRIVNLEDVPWDEHCSAEGRFRSAVANVSVALGTERNLDAAHGGHPFDLSVRRVPAGCRVCPHHVHATQWELFWVQSGQGEVRCGEERVGVGPGDVWVHPPGEAHSLAAATGGEPLVCWIVADNPPLDLFYYPDSGKWGHRQGAGPAEFYRRSPIDYFAGEE